MILFLSKVMNKDKSIHARGTSPSVSFVVAKFRPSAKKYVLKENIDTNSLFLEKKNVHPKMKKF
jgi:hypothetical protein